MVGINWFDLGRFGTPPWAQAASIPVRKPSSSTVIIVGAGITGLSAAMAFAARGIDVTVMERAFGTGATSRSGGFVLGETLVGPDPPFDRCELALAEWVRKRQIDCDWEWTTCLELAREPELSPEPIDWYDAGRVHVAAEIPGGLVDPVKLLNGLLLAAEDAGARVVDRIAVSGIEDGQIGPLVVCDEQRVAAAQTVMAVDAVSWRQMRDPFGDRNLTLVVQSEVLTSTILQAIGLWPPRPFYTRELPLLWGRPLPDGTFLFGRELLPFPWRAGGGEWPDRLARAADRLTARVRQLHEALGQIAISRWWAGPIARAPDGRPTLVKDPEIEGLWWAGGYGGHGLAQAFRLGTIVADRVISAMRSPRAT